MRLKNNKGEELKSILPNEVMEKIMEYIEQELRQKNIYYERNGSVFRVPNKNMEDLHQAQLNANVRLISEGVLTLEMLKEDFEANFL